MNTEIIYFNESLKGLFGEKLEELSSGHSFTEGPVWKESEQSLYFTDFPKEHIYKWTEKDGTTLYTDKSNRAIGLALDNNENLISCESGFHRLAVLTANGSTPIISEYDGKRFNSINDAVVARDGSFLFTDPFSKALGVPSAQGFNGVYRFSKDTQEVKVICKDFSWPNGICLNADESILYVNDTGAQEIYKFEKDGNGEYTNKELFAVLNTSYGEGAPDGMKVDKNNNVWVTGPGGIWVLSSKGERLAILKTPQFAGNFCFGGTEIFITASTSVYRVALKKGLKI